MTKATRLEEETHTLKILFTETSTKCADLGFCEMLFSTQGIFCRCRRRCFLNLLDQCILAPSHGTLWRATVNSEVATALYKQCWPIIFVGVKENKKNVCKASCFICTKGEVTAAQSNNTVHDSNGDKGNKSERLQSRHVVDSSSSINALKPASTCLKVRERVQLRLDELLL